MRLFLIILALLAASYAAPVLGADDEVLQSFGLGDDEPEITSSHFPRPPSKIAENVTVITAEEIERINAHTLADILQTVPGIQLDYLRTPGTFSFFNIQGATNTTVMLLIDGVPQNDLQSNMAEPGLIPVQQIERIEIVKGAASTAWGAALGGVINIVTKSPDPDRPLSGMISGSSGRRFTADSRAELSGTIDRLGYYLYAGNLHSDGLQPNNGINQNNLYGKLTWLLPSNGTITLGISHTGVRSGIDEEYLAGWDIVTHDTNEQRRSYGFLKLVQPLAERLALEVDGYLSSQRNQTVFGHLDNGRIVSDSDTEARGYRHAINARLHWGDSSNNLVTGLEYTHSEGKNRDLLSTNPPIYDRTWDRWAAFANGSATFGPLTILPGIRVDHTGLSGEYFSANLGATWRLSDKTLLRAYGAQGYGLPSPIYTNGLMKIRTVQGGIETGDLPFFWLKATYFHNWLRDIESTGVVELQNQNRQGFELEAKTAPLLGLSLSGGYTFTHVKDVDSGERVKTDSQWTVPPHLLKLALHYDNEPLGLRGTFTGNYLNWNAAPGTLAADGAMIWDLFLSWKICPKSEFSPELFFSGRNLFDGIQTTDTELYKNTPRWYEGGVRFRF